MTIAARPLMAWAMLLVVAAAPTGAQAAPARYTAELSNIDDSGEILLNGRRVLTCGYRKRCQVTLDRHLRRGRNSIVVRFFNKSSGFAWGYVIRDGERSLAAGRCGRAGRVSCGEAGPAGEVKTVMKGLVVD